MGKLGYALVVGAAMLSNAADAVNPVDALYNPINPINPVNSVNLVYASDKALNLESKIESGDFLEKGAVRRLRKEDLVNALSYRANEDEFAVAYFPKKEIIVNLSLKRGLRGMLLDEKKLDLFIESGERFTLIHNHNDRKLKPRERKNGNPLDWISPSILDLTRYLGKGKEIDYGIVNKYGLLIISTSDDTFERINNRGFYRELKSEANHLEQSLKGVKVDGLEKWAKDYKGMFKLRFEGVKEVK